MVGLLAAIFDGITQLRNALYDQGILPVYRSKLPVVSVGNVTVGGNGKTPLCEFLAADLKARGFTPVILSRGYGGHVRGPYRVRPTDSPMMVGDEPILLASLTNVPVFVARSRVTGIQRIEEEGAGDVVILDDGFQHRALARDCNIVSIFIGSDEGIQSWLDGSLLPKGRYRENRERALTRADIIVLSERRVFGAGEGLPPVPPAVLATLPPNVPVFRSYLESDGIRMANGATSERLPTGPVVTFAGIASPEGFFESVRRLGYTVCEERPFPDHHVYTASDISELIASAKGRPLVCTAKDLVKLRQIPNLSLDGIAVMQVTPRVTPADAFGVAVERACKR